MPRQNHEPITEQQCETFLDALAEGDSVVDAARKADHNRRSFYRLKKSDDAFAADWKSAYAEGTAALIHEAQRRAVDGLEDVKMIGSGEFQERIMFRTYSDSLLMFLIKQRDPSFRERATVEIGGNNGPPVAVEVKHTADDLLEVARILAAAGALPAAGPADTAADTVDPAQA